MYFMNEWEIDLARSRYNLHQLHPVLGPATQLLSDLRDMVNGCSDGWAYWGPPVRAAARLMTMIQHPETATVETFKASQKPIKAFCTRYKRPFPTVQPVLPFSE